MLYFRIEYFAHLNVVSSKNQGWLKLVLINGYEPTIMVLDIIWSFKLASILFVSYFLF